MMGLFYTYTAQSPYAGPILTLSLAASTLSTHTCQVQCNSNRGRHYDSGILDTCRDEPSNSNRGRHYDSGILDTCRDAPSNPNRGRHYDSGILDTCRDEPSNSTRGRHYDSGILDTCRDVQCNSTRGRHHAWNNLNIAKMFHCVHPTPKMDSLRTDFYDRKGMCVIACIFR